MPEQGHTAPPKKARTALVLAVVLAVAAAGAVFFIIGGVGSMSNLAETADLFLAELAQQNYEAAYGRLCGAYRGSYTLDEFKAAAQKNAYLRGGGRTSFNEVVSIKNTYRASGVLSSPAGNVDAQFSFVEEDGGLKITGILLGGMPAL